MLLMGLLLTMTASAAVVYRWVDDTGQVHFSDVPRDGATEITIAPVQTFNLSSAPPAAATVDAEGADELVNYDYVEIASPAMEETIWNTGGIVTVAVNLQPGLRMGHQIRLFMDDQQVAVLPPMSSSVQLTDVVRGAHRLHLEVVDENGKSLIMSPPRTFYYQQTSVTRRPKKPARAPAAAR
jgi:hypothetical protein